MDLRFNIVGKVDKNGTPCLLQRATIPVNASRQFWMVWKTCNDARLKDSCMVRKEGGVWTVYRTVPEDPGLKMPPIPMPYHLKNRTHLLPYQPRAVAAVTRSLINYGIAIDGSDTGLGKTFVCLAACRETGLRPFIICRKAGIAGWKRACAYMGIKPVSIVNWEMARTGNFQGITRRHHEYEPRWIYNWIVPKDTVLVFDEVHMACNTFTLNNDLWTSGRNIPGIYLSATMADRPSRLESLFAQLRICTREQYREWLRRMGHFTNAHNEADTLSSVQDMIEIHKLLYPRYGARLSYQDDDVADYFPGAVYQIEMITLDEKYRSMQNVKYTKMLEQVAKLREMGKSHADQMVAELRYRQATELIKVPALVEYAKDYMAQGLSVLIFVNYRDTLAQLAKHLGTRSLVFGSQDSEGLPRERVIEAFQSNRERIILCMIDAGGQSIDLHDLQGGHQRISLICPTYNPISLKQVLGRTYRANTKTKPIMKLVYADGTVETKVADVVSRKLDNIDALNRGDLMEEDIFNMRGGE